MRHALKPLAVKKAKLAEKPLKLTDGGGLYLLVNQSGKYWRYNYCHDGKRKTLALGVFPTVSLDEAWQRHHKARQELELNKTDPARCSGQNQQTFLSPHHGPCSLGCGAARYRRAHRII